MEESGCSANYPSQHSSLDMFDTSDVKYCTSTCQLFAASVSLERHKIENLWHTKRSFLWHQPLIFSFYLPDLREILSVSKPCCEKLDFYFEIFGRSCRSCGQIFRATKPTGYVDCDMIGFSNNEISEILLGGCDFAAFQGSGRLTLKFLGRRPKSCTSVFGLPKHFAVDRGCVIPIPVVLGSVNPPLIPG